MTDSRGPLDSRGPFDLLDPKEFDLLSALTSAETQINFVSASCPLLTIVVSSRKP